MVLEKSWISVNFRRVSKSRRRKQEPLNLELMQQNEAGLGILNLEI